MGKNLRVGLYSMTFLASVASKAFEWYFVCDEEKWKELICERLMYTQPVSS